MESILGRFASAIDNNTDLENVQKLNYLKSYLYGNAARAIDGFQATNENYEKAVRQLEERFGDRQVIVSGHMNKFKEIKPVQNITDINGLRELFDKLETNVRSLEAIGVQTETYEAILTPEILKKLPEELRILITRKLPDSWDLRSLLNIFREELQVREKCRFALENTEENHNTAAINTPLTRSYARQSHATTAALYSDTAGNSRSFRITCAFCANEHYSRNCEVVTDHNARREILRKKGKCYICLRSGHLARDCRSQIYCYKCKGRHHTTICDSYSKQSDKKEVTPQPKSHNQTASKVQAETQTTTNLHVSSQNSILLQTAPAKVSSPGEERKSENIRVIFDSGSQKTYVSQRVKESLSLKVIGKDRLLIKVFGDERPRVKEAEIVQIALKSVDDMEIYINAYVVPHICSPVTNQILGIAVERI